MKTLSSLIVISLALLCIGCAATGGPVDPSASSMQPTGGEAAAQAANTM